MLRLPIYEAVVIVSAIAVAIHHYHKHKRWFDREDVKDIFGCHEGYFFLLLTLGIGGLIQWILQLL
jgi:hypothetical protein